MTAVVQIIEKNGAGGSATDKTSLTVRFKGADNPTVDLNARLRVPPLGQHAYSFEKWMRLRVTQAPSVDIANIVFYTDGENSFGAGVTLFARASASFAEPVQVEDEDGWTGGFTYTSAAPLALGAGPYDNFSSLPVEIGDHVVAMMRVDDNAGPGITPSETLVFAFDET